MGQVLFVIGTDTSVGKTIVTALLLSHLREKGVAALAMKPFASGSKGDIRLLQSLQVGAISDEEMNPFYFRKGVTPLVAARAERRSVSIRNALRSIKKLQEQSDVLLVEGAGGLLSPLGGRYSAAELIAALNCEVILVARNRLGTLNHTLLTLDYLRQTMHQGVRIVLNNLGVADLSASSNAGVLRRWQSEAEVVELPFLGRKKWKAEGILEAQKKLKKVLAHILQFDSFIKFFRMESTGDGRR